MMMMTFITQGVEGQRKMNKKRKATKSKGRSLEEGARRALMRQVGEEGCGRGQSHNRYNVSSVPRKILTDVTSITANISVQTLPRYFVLEGPESKQNMARPPSPIQQVV